MFRILLDHGDELGKNNISLVKDSTWRYEIDSLKSSKAVKNENGTRKTISVLCVDSVHCVNIGQH